MVDVGDSAPDFTVPIADGEIGSFTLSDHLDDAPIVLAFFPAAFTSTCTTEMCTFRDQLANFEAVGATVYGVSVDLPFTLNEFRDQNDLNFGLLSDAGREVVDAYDVKRGFRGLEVNGVAKRAVFVVDRAGVVTYKWVSEELAVEPDYDAVREAVGEAEAQAADD